MIPHFIETYWELESQGSSLNSSAVYLKPKPAQTYCIAGGKSLTKDTAFRNGERSHTFHLCMCQAV